MMQDDFGNWIKPQSLTLIERLDANDARFDAGDARMTRIEAGQADTTAAVERIEGNLAANTKATKETAASTSDLVDILNALKGAFKTLDFIGKLAKPLGYIVALGAAVAGVWASIKTGSPR